jgi:hypothetical protein
MPVHQDITASLTHLHLLRAPQVLSTLVVLIQLTPQWDLILAELAPKVTRVPTMVWPSPSNVVKDTTHRLALKPAPCANPGTNAQERLQLPPLTNWTPTSVMVTIVKSGPM